VTLSLQERLTLVVLAASFFQRKLQLFCVKLVLPLFGICWIGSIRTTFKSQKLFNILLNSIFAEFYTLLYLKLIFVLNHFLNFLVTIFWSVPEISCHVITKAICCIFLASLLFQIEFNCFCRSLVAHHLFEGHVYCLSFFLILEHWVSSVKCFLPSMAQCI